MPDHDPKWDKLIPAGDGELYLPSPAPKMHEITYEVGIPGSEKAEYTYVYRMFNRYKWERVKARDQHNIIREKATGNSRGEGAAKQSEYYQERILRWAFVLFQKYELSRTDLTLKEYYETVTGAKLGIPAGTYGVARVGYEGAKLAPRAALYLGRASGICRIPAASYLAGAATSAGAASAATTIAVGLADAAAAFIFVTYIMAWAVPDSKVEASGWFPVGGDWDGFYFKPGDVQIRYEDKVEQRDTVWR